MTEGQDIQAAEIRYHLSGAVRRAPSGHRRRSPPGPDTAILRGKNETMGIGIVEEFKLN